MPTEEEFTIATPSDEEEFTIQKPSLREIAARRKARLEAEGGGTATQQVQAAAAKDINFGGAAGPENFSGPVSKAVVGAYAGDRVRDIIQNASQLLPGGWLYRAAAGSTFGLAGGLARESIRRATGNEKEDNAALALSLGIDTAVGSFTGIGKGPTPWHAGLKEIEMATLPKMVMRAASGETAGRELLDTALAQTRTSLDEAIRAATTGAPPIKGVAASPPTGDVEQVYKTLSKGLSDLKSLSKGGGQVVAQVNAMGGRVASLLQGSDADVVSGMARRIPMDKLIQMKGNLQQWAREVGKDAVKDSPQWREAQVIKKASEELHQIIRKELPTVSKEAAALYDQANRIYKVMKQRDGVVGLAENIAESLAKKQITALPFQAKEFLLKKLSSWMMQKAWGDGTARPILQEAMRYAEKGMPATAKRFAGRAFLIIGADKAAERLGAMTKDDASLGQQNYVPPPPE